jgi:hypothetical protein
MIIWGGNKQTGSLYCDCSAGTFYRDADGDGRGDPLRAVCGPAAGYVATGNDCNDASAVIWGPPGEVAGVRFTDATTLAWDPPATPGGTVGLAYDVVRSSGLYTSPERFFACLVPDVPFLSTTITETPAAGKILYYQVRAQNGCPGGIGSLGFTSSGRPRTANACP